MVNGLPNEKRDNNHPPGQSNRSVGCFIVSRQTALNLDYVSHNLEMAQFGLFMKTNKDICSQRRQFEGPHIFIV